MKAINLRSHSNRYYEERSQHVFKNGKFTIILLPSTYYCLLDLRIQKGNG